MHIAIDVSPLYSGHKFRGVGSYTQSLIDALRTYERGHTFTLVKDESGIPRDADLVHYPYFDPFFLTLPVYHRKPTVVTVHDLIPLKFPGKFPAGVRGSIKWFMQKKSLQRQNAVVTDSLASKEDIQHIARIPDSMISVIYLAPAEGLQKICDRERLQKVKKKYALPDRYMLYVGDVNWNKNIPGLIRAFSLVQKKKAYKGIQLVLVGDAFKREDLKETQYNNRIIRKHNLEKEIVKTGRVDNEELAVLYSMAYLYVQPSFYEGFGLPVLEAMTCGCPVVCVNTSSLREIAGPAIAVSAEPESIAKGIERVFVQDTKRLTELQSEWVQQFSWKKSSHAMMNIYAKVLGKI